MKSVEMKTDYFFSVRTVIGVSETPKIRQYVRAHSNIRMLRVPVNDERNIQNKNAIGKKVCRLSSHMCTAATAVTVRGLPPAISLFHFICNKFVYSVFP